jgi:ubiquitin carboxyl-terminal hydrolase 22/27/51
LLIVPPQRFEHTLTVSEKLEGRIDFPMALNMLPYTTKANYTKADKSKYMYDLASAVVHRGKLDAGHYYVYCRQGDQVRILERSSRKPPVF